MASNTPAPREIKLHQKSRVLEISFADGKTFRLPCEFLRVYSPSAEVRGHGPGQEVLQTGKKDVEITKLERSADMRSNPRSPTGTARGSTRGTCFTTTARTRTRCGGSICSGSKPQARAARRRLRSNAAGRI
jgi:hypothetical protein